jgi:hypothetical protein
MNPTIFPTPIDRAVEEIGQGRSLFFRNIPGIEFPFIECDLDQPSNLSLDANALSELLDQAKRGAASLNLLQARVAQ